MANKLPDGREIIGQFRAKVSAPSPDKSSVLGKPRLTLPQSRIKLGDTEFDFEGLATKPVLKPSEKVFEVTVFRRKAMGARQGNIFSTDAGKKQCRVWLSSGLMFEKTGVDGHEVTVDVLLGSQGHWVLRVPIHHLKLAQAFKGKSVRET